MKHYLSFLKKAFFNTITKKLISGILVINALFLIATLFMIHYQSIIIEVGIKDYVALTDIRNFVVLIATITSVLAIVIGLYLSYSITRPINQLLVATELLEKGHYTQVSIATGDELEKLAEAFNKASLGLHNLERGRRKLETLKREFLSILSHELRSPMTPMKAQLQMLLENYLGRMSKEQKEALEIVLRNTTRLDTIISELLELSRIESAHLTFNFVKTNLKEESLKLVHDMQVYAREREIKIVTKIEDLPLIEVDPDRVMQVLRNLINNAIKFSKPRGVVVVSVHRQSNWIHFSIEDHGVGISEDNQKRLFIPFFQVDKSLNRKYGGIGLGLAICKGIVEAQNGKIWVKSQLGKGATFSFTVPMKPLRISKLLTTVFGKKED